MNLVHFLIFGGLVMHTPLALDRDFFEWWSKHDEQLQSEGDYVHRYVKKIEVPFTALREYEGSVEKPEGAGQESVKLYVLFSDEDGMLLLATPEKSMQDDVVLDEGYVKQQRKCRGNRSWLVLLPQNAWTPVNLNPYCSMDYGEEQIGLYFYWTDSSNRPHIDIVTSGLTCTPHQLYGWNKKQERYGLSSLKCTGPKSFGDYPSATPYKQFK